MTFEASILVRATLVLILGLAASRLARRARASVRHLVLTSTFGALLVLPTLAAVTPAVVVEIPVASPSSRAIAPVETPSTMAPAPSGRGALSFAAPASFGPSMATALRMTWALGSLALLATLGASLWNLRRIRRSGIPWMVGETSARALARESGLRLPLTVLLHQRIAVPVTCGLTRPAIVLPPDAREWSEADLQRAFVHEQAPAPILT